MLLIDDHGSRVSAPVWALYSEAMARFAAAAPLVEWDSNLPALAILLDEAAAADEMAHVIDHKDDRHVRIA